MPCNAYASYLFSSHYRAHALQRKRKIRRNGTKIIWTKCFVSHANALHYPYVPFLPLPTGDNKFRNKTKLSFAFWVDINLFYLHFNLRLFNYVEPRNNPRWRHHIGIWCISTAIISAYSESRTTPKGSFGITSKTLSFFLSASRYHPTRKGISLFLLLMHKERRIDFNFNFFYTSYFDFH